MKLLYVICIIYSFFELIDSMADWMTTDYCEKSIDISDVIMVCLSFIIIII